MGKKKHLPIPQELDYLIEKRERETDRRKSSSPGARPAGLPERRKNADRRRKPRRESGS